MSPIRGVISDFGGVLTTPLVEAFAAVQEQSGIPVEALGRAMARVAARDGANPLFELETGRISEEDFLAAVGEALAEELGREVHLRGFGQFYFANLHANHELIAYMRSLRERGLRLAILTNNVREWEPLWRSKLPVDEIFDVVVDSAFVGMRKPDREIFELTLARLGLSARECVFVDDTEINCQAARDLGMAAVLFRSSQQAIAEVEAVLGAAHPGSAT
ncbi:MAG TPA: HAD family phosphatase [Solirubrobacteraceae bacterium]|nr:HAD family phosphatase [Solirubrobacteraceae bacterium]